MKRAAFVFGAVWLVLGCTGGERIPKSAYDPKLLDDAQAIAKENEEHRRALEEHSREARAEEAVRGECDRDEGGCPADHVCWDSFFCKDGSTDSCSAAGDMMCHKRCKSDRDCTARMPRCVEKPIFKGSEDGVLEKFCVGGAGSGNAPASRPKAPPRPESEPDDDSDED
jgi:hypothetical protein